MSLTDTPVALKLIAPPSIVAPFSVKVTLLILVKPDSSPAAIAPPTCAWLSVNIECITVALSALMSIAPPIPKVSLVTLFPVNIQCSTIQKSL